MRQTPEKMRELAARLKGKMNLKSLVLTLAVLVVFTTTYLLILPAFTLDKDEAAQQGGIDVVAIETTATESAEAEDEEQPVAETADVKDEEPAVVKEDEDKADDNKPETNKAEEKGSDVLVLTKKSGLEAEGDGFTVKAAPESKTEVPAATELVVSEVTSQDKELAALRKEALNALKEDSSDVKDIKEIKVYDMALEADGESVSTDSKFNVKIEYEDGVKVEDADNIRVLTFDDQNNAAVLDTYENNVETKVEAAGSKSNVTEASFETEGISKVAVVEVETIEKTFITADGQTYKVTVKYDKNAQIPAGSELEVKELTGDDYDAYLEKAAGKLDKSADDLSLAKFFDITIKNGNDEVKIANPVDVEIKLLDSDNLSNDVQVLHFANENNADLVNSKVEGDTVKFEAEGFSIYAIVGDEQDDHKARVKYIFQNADGSSYTFTNTAGEVVDNQIIKSGESLENVGTPSVDVESQTFQGWALYKKNGEEYELISAEFLPFDTPITINTGASTTSVTRTTVNISDADNTSSAEGNPDYTLYVRPFYGAVCYLTFYNDTNGPVVANKVQVIQGAKFDISTEKAYPPDAVPEVDDQGNPVLGPDGKPVYKSATYAFTGWSRTGAEIERVGHPDTRTEITDTEITVNESESFYPIFRLSHWVNFVTAPSGSGATYYAPVYILSGNTTEQARPSTTPTWEGHTFVGWFTEPDNNYLSGNESSDNAYTFDEQLKNDITLYAHWNAGKANYTIIYWIQQVTDDKNYTDAQKNYEYGGQKNVQGDVNSTVTAGDAFEQLKAVSVVKEDGTTEIQDKTIGFEYNASKSDQSIVVEADGSSTINIYLDRKLIQMVFVGLGNSQGVYYTPTTSNSGTQYGYVNGQYVELTRSNGQVWSYDGREYSGNRYKQTTNNNGDQFGFVDGKFVPLTRSSETTTNYVWYYNDYYGREYQITGYYCDGIFYTKSGNSYIASSYTEDNYPPATDTTQYYAYDTYDKEYYELNRREAGTSTTYTYKYTDETGTEHVYTETRYLAATDNNGTQYGAVDGECVVLTRGYLYTYGADNTPYSGTRYSKTTENNTTVYTGLYGQSLEQNNYSWPSPGSGNGWYDGDSFMSYLGEFVLPDKNATSIRFTKESGDVKTIYFYLQDVNGNYPSSASDTGYAPGYTFNFTEKYDGFTFDSYQLGNNGNSSSGNWTSGSAGGSVGFGNNTRLGIKYRRLSYIFKYLDSRNGTELSDVPSKTLVYEAPLSSANPNKTSLTPPSSQYEWDGHWYTDQECTTIALFNANTDRDGELGDYTSIDTTNHKVTYGTGTNAKTYSYQVLGKMPNHDFAVYAGWKQIWYWVKIDPNGGELTGTEATWFWETYGDKVQEYHDVTRRFVEDENGTYYYHYDELNPETGLNQDDEDIRKAYYTTDASKSTDGGKKYKEDTKAYTLIGWYKVDLETGETLMDQPFNFDEGITGNTWIRAVWRQVGDYTVAYSNLGVTDKGVFTEVNSGAENVPHDFSHYADKSYSSIMGPITDVPDGYVFTGWYYDGHVYNPGDAFQLNAELDKNDPLDTEKDSVITIFPVFVKYEDLPVKTTHIYWYGNTKDIAGGDIEAVTTEPKDEDTYKNLQINKAISIMSIDELLEKNNAEEMYEGYEFIGWAKQTENDTTYPTSAWLTAEKDADGNYTGTYSMLSNGETITGITHIAADELLVGTDEDQYEKLVAVWQKKTYTVTVEKKVNSVIAADQETPFAFTPSFSFTRTDLQQNFSLTGKNTTIGGTEYKTTKVFEEIPYGTTFSFTENAPDFTAVEEAVRVKKADGTSDGSIVEKTNGVYTVTGDIKVTFTNTRNTFDIEFEKTDATDTTEFATIDGSTFKLYKANGQKDSEGNPIYETYKDADNKDVVMSLGLTTQTLVAGDYKLEETNAPDGYLLLDEPIYFSIASDGEVTLTQSDAAIFREVGPDSTAIKRILIKNTPGEPLPMTGGIGTTIFYILGSLLVIGCGIVLVSRKRMGSSK